MDLGFAYFINGEWRSSSWPRTMTRTRVEQWDVEWHKKNPAEGYPASMLGKVMPIEADEFEVPVSDEELELINAQDHFWYEYRNAGGHAVCSIGYGFVAAALAEEVHGRLASYDCAFQHDGHNGETAEQFLTWWGDEEMDFYDIERFR